ncbi:DsbA family protein [Blastococcus mobilis]|uniref:DsbA family protein n=1 Tax=Blastococcus mobilis TaxID=1938746 RepID=UPI0020CC5DF5|nr:thioredoxin domain-containing protein [Blastococcus mobilis]
MVVVLGVVAVVWGLGRGDGKDGGGAPVADVRHDGGSETGEPADTLARRIPGDPLAQGDADAPVVLVMWEDFQCPFCAKFAQETEPVLVDRFVEDGILRLEWRDFPYFGEQSVQAARAARAAGEQGAFWQYHDAVYALGFPPNSGQLTDEVLTGVAADLGLDVERFTATMQSQQTLDAVTADFQEGQQLGIAGTPAFLVNGRPIMGAQPTDTFVEAIEQAAQQAASDG